MDVLAGRIHDERIAAKVISRASMLHEGFVGRRAELGRSFRPKRSGKIERVFRGGGAEAGGEVGNLFPQELYISSRISFHLLIKHL